MLLLVPYRHLSVGSNININLLLARIVGSPKYEKPRRSRLQATNALRRERLFKMMTVTMMAFFRSLVNISIGMGRVPFSSKTSLLF